MQKEREFATETQRHRDFFVIFLCASVPLWLLLSAYMDSKEYNIVGLGEILWDLLPGGRKPGGAPANFAYHAFRLGNRSRIASRVGTDVLGCEAIDRLKALELSADCVQADHRHPTGTVYVEVDPKGQPHYTITEDVAWDHLEWTPEWQELAAGADAVCFGSLAQRSACSRQTIHRFLRATRKDALRIFDVNLRQSFYSWEVLKQSLKLARIVKLNDQELPVVIELLGFDYGNQKASARRLLEVFDLDLVCVTRGSLGSLLVSADEMFEHPGINIKVADTVGAGDAFTAALAHYYLHGKSLEVISDAANRLGAWVASQVGATPVIKQCELKRIVEGADKSWQT